MLPPSYTQQMHTYRIVGTDDCGNKSSSGKIGRPIHLQGDVVNENDRAYLFFTPYLDWDNQEIEYALSRIENERENEIFKTKIGTSYHDNEFLNEGNIEQCYRVSAHTLTSVSHSNIICLPYKPMVFIPNTITPNNDGLNDVFAPVTYGIKTYTICIYNRWGELIYNGNSPWKAENCSQGVYAFVISLKTSDGQMIYKNGTVNLLY